MGLQVTSTVTSNGNLVDVDIEKVKRRVFAHAAPLARRFGEAYQNNLKLAIVGVKAIATGETLHSVKDEMLLESASRSLIMRRVVAKNSIFWIQHGRKPGKAPIRFVGYRPGKRKAMVKVFEPLPGLVKWFLALNIPRALWMPIARAIGRRGIKPREVQVRAVRRSEPAWRAAIERFGVNLTRDIFK